MPMNDLHTLALDEAKRLGATYADYRQEDITEQSLSVSDGSPELLNKSYSTGFAIRVIADGAWGFAADSIVNEDSIKKTVATAVEIARASAKINKSALELADRPVYEDSYTTPFEKDPFAIPLSEKIEFLSELERMMRIDSQINSTSAFMTFIRTQKFYASLDGSRISQDIYQAGCGASCGVIKSHRDRSERSFPTPNGQWITGGYEIMDVFDFKNELPRIAQEAVQLLSAKDCPQKEMDLILGGDLVSLQIHESVGHPLELDRVFGYERNFSGVSFATTDKLDSLKYASDIMTFVADSTYPGGLATYAYDDEGVKTERDVLIDKGILVNYLSDRETAYRIGKKSTACARAEGWMNTPIVRIPNILLLPGESTLDEMISGVDDGIYVIAPNSWSIDDNREGFTLGGEVGWEIKNGKLGEMVKSPRYSGNTVDFWNSCDAVGNSDSWVLWGTPNCGKGQPGQNMRTAQGCSPCRFRKVKVG
ncbi:MAG: TldD/PmbA family protein [candidate division Zixibacteria bacterium]|nr:TldD/PmbA family protein [candidate division Zixibacteria bacterium]NIR66053.1 TldD/PmbA family protein [candidate division Zixibacteria bacterium]NIS17137.1 TldD/PmbA family protein [candidate division Zixibacteria bacterium]NIS47683.1 TldD/PmbA family protein [candidate division Zixibacteria bacterium]NIT53492.1 TldD/PmbA family protein [candidate division Zixibacteria bacterium]